MSAKTGTSRKKHPKSRVRTERIANRLKRQHPNMDRSLAHAIARGRVRTGRQGRSSQETYSVKVRRFGYSQTRSRTISVDGVKAKSPRLARKKAQRFLQVTADRQ